MQIFAVTEENEKIEAGDKDGKVLKVFLDYRYIFIGCGMATPKNVRFEREVYADSLNDFRRQSADFVDYEIYFADERHVQTH